MNHMPYRYLTPPAAAPGNVAERFFARLMSLMVWALLATMGMVLALSLLVWLVVMAVVSLVGSVFTGRPGAVAVLWRRYRELTAGLARQRWPHGERRASGTRATADSASAAAPAAGVQDVRWRDVATRPAHGAASAPSRH